MTAVAKVSARATEMLAAAAGGGRTMPEMKAGPELDARLCGLLEEKPKASRKIFSPLGFWKWHWISNVRVGSNTFGGHEGFLPIPVSTDWAAMGKVVESLVGAGWEIAIDWAGWTSNGAWTVALARDPVGESVSAYADPLPLAITLAAIGALEKQAPAIPEGRPLLAAPEMLGDSQIIDGEIE